jgi:hypothetical protein
MPHPGACSMRQRQQMRKLFRPRQHRGNLARPLYRNPQLFFTAHFAAILTEQIFRVAIHRPHLSRFMYPSASFQKRSFVPSLSAIFSLSLSILLQPAYPQASQLPSADELAAVASRGRALADYDLAAWHATDAVQTANPKTIEGQKYIARKENGKWRVVFGALSADKSRFVIAYDAVQQPASKDFSVKPANPPQNDNGFFLFAARAIELAAADFGKVSRPYNIAVLPATGDEAAGQQGLLYVYFYPGQTRPGIFPLGGDVRYLISADGTQILSRRQLHKSIIESPPPKGKKLAAGFHTHILSDAPEDTDVLHVLLQDPPLPEFVSTPHAMYKIAENASITIEKKR